MKRSGPRYLLTLFALFALLLSACQTADTPKEDSTPDADSPAATGTASFDANAPIDGLKTNDRTVHGPIVVTLAGRAVYVFTNDTGSEPTCNDQCALRWPPVRGSAEVPGTEGADSELIGQTTRQDGSNQVTYNGHPIYFYAADVEPGDTRGHGFGEPATWFVVSPQGEAVRKA